ncbi:regulator of sigma E protease [Trypanosoma cruzi]|nr:regulator of sigma E protease [Trypanosoma cruzi]
MRRRRESIAQETEKSPARHPGATRWQSCRGCLNATTTNSAATTEPCTLTHSVFSQSEQQGQRKLRHTTHSAAEHPKHTQQIKNGCKKPGRQKNKKGAYRLKAEAQKLFEVHILAMTHKKKSKSAKPSKSVKDKAACTNYGGRGSRPCPSEKQLLARPRFHWSTFPLLFAHD